jgi:hypothetical protein
MARSRSRCAHWRQRRDHHHDPLLPLRSDHLLQPFRHLLGGRAGLGLLRRHERLPRARQYVAAVDRLTSIYHRHHDRAAPHGDGASSVTRRPHPATTTTTGDAAQQSPMGTHHFKPGVTRCGGLR